MRAAARQVPALDVGAGRRTDALTSRHRHYRMRGRDRQCPAPLSFRMRRGEAYGLVGESGCGKSTVAIAIAALSCPQRPG